MKKYALLFIILVLVGCAGYPPSTATSTPIKVRTVKGDNLPEELPSYTAIDLAQRSQWQDIDALLISKDFLYKARDDANLKHQLQSVARQLVLLIYDATTEDIAQILQLQSPTITTTTTRYLFVAVWATNSKIISGGYLVPIDRETPIDISAAIDEFVRSLQEKIE